MIPHHHVLHIQPTLIHSFHLSSPNTFQFRICIKYHYFYQEYSCFYYNIHWSRRTCTHAHTYVRARAEDKGWNAPMLRPETHLQNGWYLLERNREREEWTDLSSIAEDKEIVVYRNWCCRYDFARYT